MLLTSCFYRCSGALVLVTAAGNKKRSLAASIWCRRKLAILIVCGHQEQWKCQWEKGTKQLDIIGGERRVGICVLGAEEEEAKQTSKQVVQKCVSGADWEEATKWIGGSKKRE